MLFPNSNPHRKNTRLLIGIFSSYLTDEFSSVFLLMKRQLVPFNLPSGSAIFSPLSSKYKPDELEVLLQFSGSCHRGNVKNCAIFSFISVHHVFLIIHFFIRIVKYCLYKYFSAQSQLPIDFVTFLLLLPSRPASSFVSLWKLYRFGGREHVRKDACLYQNISPCVSEMFTPKQLLLCFMNIPVRTSSFQLSTVMLFPRESLEYVN